MAASNIEEHLLDGGKVTNLRRAINMGGFQCSDCNLVLSWLLVAWDSEVFESQPCDCEFRTRRYRVRKEDAPTIKAEVFYNKD